MSTSKVSPEITVTPIDLNLSRTESDLSDENKSFIKKKSIASTVEDLKETSKDIKSNNDEVKLKEIILEWGSTSSAHGFPGISSKNTNWLIKCVWLVLMLASWIYCFYTIIKTMIQFYEYRVDTKIEFVNEIPASFPEIDICNLSPYKYTPTNADLNMSMSLDPVYFNDSSKFNDTFRNYLREAEIHIKASLNFYNHLIIRNETNFDNITFNWSEIFQSCKFKNKKCNESDFDYFSNFYYGKCFSFNRDNTRTLSKPGWKYGLQLELSVGLYELLALNAGFKILINNQTLNSYPEENGIEVSPGFLTNIAISRTYNEKLANPYNDCLDNFYDSKYNYLILKSQIVKQMKTNLGAQSEYDPNLCFKMCYQKFFIDKCGCTMMDLPNYGPYDPDSCFFSNKTKCIYEYDDTFFNTSAVDDCITACPDRCTEFSYSTKISFSKYPSEWYANYFLDENKTVIEDYLNHVALVNIYFNEMPYTHVYQEPSITVESLFGTIGGQLGK